MEANKNYNKNDFQPKFNGWIMPEDVADESIEMIPIRQGCGPWACACSGSCKNIVGRISREEYNKYIAACKLAELLWERTEIKFIEE